MVLRFGDSMIYSEMCFMLYLLFDNLTLILRNNFNNLPKKYCKHFIHFYYKTSLIFAPIISLNGIQTNESNNINIYFLVLQLKHYTLGLTRLLC